MLRGVLPLALPLKPVRGLAGQGSGGQIRLYGAAMESNHPTVGLPRPAGFEDRMGHRPRAAPRAHLASNGERGVAATRARTAAAQAAATAASARTGAASRAGCPK